MSEPEWHIRSGQPSDRDLLAVFACADPAVDFEAEVEQFIRAQLIDWAFDPHAADGDPRLLLAFITASGELFGVAAHERVMLGDGETRFDATKLEVAALARPWQGYRFNTGERASDVLMSAVMTDVSARVPPRDARIAPPGGLPLPRLARPMDRPTLAVNMNAAEPCARRRVRKGEE